MLRALLGQERCNWIDLFQLAHGSTVQEVQVVGRMATVISRSLQGKDRPDFVPQSDGGDVVVVLNADKVVLTGSKMQNKIYYRHMSKPGNLRKSTPEEKKEMFGGAELVWQAVNGMLPKNKLRKVCGLLQTDLTQVQSSLEWWCIIYVIEGLNKRRCEFTVPEVVMALLTSQALRFIRYSIHNVVPR